MAQPHQLEATRSASPIFALLPARGLALLAGALVARALLPLFVTAPAGWYPWLGLLFVVPVDVLTLVVVAALLRREGSTVRALLGRFRASDLGWGVAVGLALLVAMLVGQYVGNLIVYQGPPPLPSQPWAAPPVWFGLWSLLVPPATIAFAEELCYRGYLQPRASRRWGAWVGIVVVALFFGLQHIPFALSTPGGAFVKVVSTFVGGLVLGWLYHCWGRLWPLIIGHWLVDVVGLGLPPLLLALAAS